MRFYTRFVVAMEPVENARRVAVDIAVLRCLWVHVASIVFGVDRAHLRAVETTRTTSVTRTLAAWLAARFRFRRRGNRAFHSRNGQHRADFFGRQFECLTPLDPRRHRDRPVSSADQTTYGQPQCLEQ